MKQPQSRRRCRHCDGHTLVNKSGKLRQHAREATYGRVWCEGSGEKPAKLWSTTVYEPVNDGGHRDVLAGDSRDCTVCGLPYWDAAHKLAERHVPDAVETVPGLYCVEASDDRGRSYAANMLRWVDVEDAKSWASGLSMRWFGCTDIRVRACDEDGEPTGDTVYQTLSSER